MLRDFTVQPAASGSPAGKAYTHQFPEHVFLYLGMFLIEHVLILHREARCWLLIGHGPSYDGALSPSPVRRAISRNTQRNSTESDGTTFREKLSTRSQWQRTRNTRNAHHTLDHRPRNCTTKDTGLRVAASSTGSSSPVRSDRSSCLKKNHKNHNRHCQLVGQAAAEKEKERKKERVSREGEREIYLYLEDNRKRPGERKQDTKDGIESFGVSPPSISPAYIRACLRRTRTLESRVG